MTVFILIVSFLYHILLIFTTKLSTVFLSKKFKDYIKDKTWDLTLRLDNFKIKPWLKKIKAVEPLFPESSFKIPTRLVTLVAFFTFCLIYFKVVKNYIYDDNGYIVNKDYFVKVRFFTYALTFSTLSLIIRFFRRVLKQGFLSKTLLSIVVFLHIRRFLPTL